MADAAYLDEQWAHRYDPHVAPLNRLVDELGHHDGAGHPPYIAPHYRGVGARGLSLLRDPGPKAGGEEGSGFLSVENDDRTAERQFGFMVGADVDRAGVVPWNAYPWYINAAPGAAQLRAGSEPLRRVIDLLSELRVVLLQGRHAQQAWRYFEAVHPDVTASRDLLVLRTYHPSPQALQHPDPAVRAAREQSIRDAFVRAKALL